MTGESQRSDERRAPETAASFVRSTTIVLGPLRISREERRYGTSDAQPVAAPRGGALRTLALAGLICTTVGGIAVAANRAPMLSDYIVSVPVPSPQTIAGTARAVPPTVRRDKNRTLRPASPATDRAPDDILLESSAATRVAAIDAALRTGEVQEWRDPNGATHGYIVAGPAQDEGTLACRDLSILTRAPGETDHVDQRRECRARPAG